MTKTDQRGFSLIEMMIVVGIIGSLAAVVLLNMNRFVGESDTEANARERRILQAAIDLMLTDLDMDVTNTAAINLPTNDWSVTNFSNQPGALAQVYPDFLRNPVSKCSYTTNVAGRILTQSCP